MWAPESEYRMKMKLKNEGEIIRGILAGILAVGSLVYSFVNFENAKFLWAFTVPIITPRARAIPRRERALKTFPACSRLFSPILA
jgi:hypothetical protein